MNVSIPVDYVEKRLGATNLDELGNTAAKFAERLALMVDLVKKCDPQGSITLTDGEAQMLDVYLNEVKPARKPRQTKIKTKA